MFGSLWESVESWSLFDIRVLHYKPTWLGRLWGMKPRWTLYQFDGQHGGWLINGAFSGSREIEINEPVTAIAVNDNIEIHVSRSWKQDVVTRIHAPSHGYWRTAEHLPPRKQLKQLATA